jgi:hypothetical protein
VWASAALAAFVAALGVIGADALWLVPLGDRIVHGELPGSIPYATAPTSGWHDVPAGGQLVFWAFYHAFGGDRGLVLAQALAAAVGLGSLAHGLGRRASGGGVLLVAALAHTTGPGSRAEVRRPPSRLTMDGLRTARLSAPRRRLLEEEKMSGGRSYPLVASSSSSSEEPATAGGRC